LPRANVPDSVVHQYRGENFTTSTWPDSAPSGPEADMSINGVSATTLNGDRAASSDGVDDFGVVDGGGPQTLPAQSDSFGVAFTFESSQIKDRPAFSGVINNTGSIFAITDNVSNDGKNGNIDFFLRDDNGSDLSVSTVDNTFFDGAVHLVCINKLDDTTVDMYVDDMSIAKGVSTDKIGFSSADYSADSPMAFFARNNTGTIQRHRKFDAGLFEFNEETYSQQDRLDLLRRAPGL
jgi:hypothetical protein